MFFELKRLFLRQYKQLEYKIRVFRSNLAVRRAFQGKKGVPHGKAAAVLCGFLALAAIIVWSSSKPSRVEEPAPPGPTLSIPSYAPLDTPAPAETGYEGTYKIVVDKSNSLLFILDNNSRVRQKFPVLLGEREGDKHREGDLKTPTGVYRIVEIKEDKDLLPMYGPYAFVLNYPNEMDLKRGKTGSGIWIHGMGNQSRNPVTRGCVVVDDAIILKLTAYIKEDTEIYIFPDEFNVPVQGEKIPAEVLSSSFLYGLLDKSAG